MTYGRGKSLGPVQLAQETLIGRVQERPSGTCNSVHEVRRPTLVHVRYFAA